MRVNAVPYKGSGRNAAVALTVDIAPSAISFADRDGKDAFDLQIHYIATDARKGVFPEWRHTRAIEISPADRERLTDGGLRVVSQLDLPDGRYQIRVASASGEQSGSVVYDLDVPDFRDDGLSLSGIAVTSAATSRVLTLQAETARNAKRMKCSPPRCSADTQAGSALARWPTSGGASLLATLQGALSAPPTTMRDFGGDETLTLYVEAYDNGTRVEKVPPYEIVLTATLRDATDAVVREVSEKRASRATRLPSGGHGFTMPVPLEGIAPGDYVLQVEARSEREPGRPATRRIPVHVVVSRSS